MKTLKTLIAAIIIIVFASCTKSDTIAPATTNTSTVVTPNKQTINVDTVMMVIIQSNRDTVYQFSYNSTHGKDTDVTTDINKWYNSKVDTIAQTASEPFVFKKGSESGTIVFSGTCAGSCMSPVMYVYFNNSLKATVPMTLQSGYYIASYSMSF